MFLTETMASVHSGSRPKSQLSLPCHTGSSQNLSLQLYLSNPSGLWSQLLAFSSSQNTTSGSNLPFLSPTVPLLEKKNMKQLKGFLRLRRGRNANQPQNQAVQSFIGVCTPGRGSLVRRVGRGSCTQAGNVARFYAPNFGWLSSCGLGIGLFEPSGNLSLVVLFRLRLP